MPQAIKTMSDAQLRALIALLVETATPMSMASVDREIDEIGAELMRRRNRNTREAANA